MCNDDVEALRPAHPKAILRQLDELAQRIVGEGRLWRKRLSRHQDSRIDGRRRSLGGTRTPIDRIEAHRLAVIAGRNLGARSRNGFGEATRPAANSRRLLASRARRSRADGSRK